MRGRTLRSFPAPVDLWRQVDAWAAETGFTLSGVPSEHRFYRKGHGLMMAPACVEIRRDGTVVTLEAWVKADAYLVVSLLTGLPAESRIESGGMTAALPRRRARLAVNRLLVNLGQDPIA